MREECRLKVLRRICGPKRDKVTREWRKLHNEELNDVYSTYVIRVIKSRRMRWVDWTIWLRIGIGGGQALVDAVMNFQVS
jgi:hypothetical protein